MQITSSLARRKSEGIMAVEARLATLARLRPASLVGLLTTALLALALLGPAPAHAVPPSITCPAAITVEADQTGGADVTPGSATASDGDGDVVKITSPSAGFYPLGTTTVTYTATDSSGNSSSCTSTITVVDTTAPSITCPSDITAAAGAGGTAVVTYSAQASDIADATPTVTFSPPSGSAFSIGTTNVTATATDQSGNRSSCGFTVTVQQSLPTAKVQCDNGGWQSFGIFRNQGECISFVNRTK